MSALRLLVVLVVLAVASPAAAQSTLVWQSFTRSATVPHVATLVAAISPSLIAGSLHVSVQPNGANYTVLIGAASWNGVTLASVQAQVDAAPADTLNTRAKAYIDSLSDEQKCAFRAWIRAALSGMNPPRTQPATTFASISEATAIANIKTEIDAVCP